MKSNPSDIRDISSLPPSQHLSSIGIFHLKRFWAKSLMKRSGHDLSSLNNEHCLDRLLIDSLGLSISNTLEFIIQYEPTFQALEGWVKKNGQFDFRRELVSQFNQLILGELKTKDYKKDGLTDEQLNFFEEHGYVILKNAIDESSRIETLKTIASFLEIDLEKPDDWYKQHPAKHGIMVEFFKHELLEKNRFSEKIRGAYESLWQRSDLWTSCDRIGINPPETDSFKFPGPNLHLDIEPKRHLPFGLQGILYLTDTEPNQGTLTVVPGFHKKIDLWLAQFPENQIPLIDVFDEFESKPIAAQGGDMIIWHQALPHGSSPNINTKPRIVQYINMYPPKFFSL